MSNELEYTNPKFRNYKDFVRYCYLYDPSVEMATGLCLSRNMNIRLLQNNWYRFGFDLLHKYWSPGSGFQYYYTCLAPYRDSVNPYKILEIVRNYQKKIASAKGERRKKSYEQDLLEELTQSLDQWNLTKQYIYYSFEDKDGWMIIERTRRIQQLRDPLIGTGKTLQKASINLENNRARQFNSNLDEIQTLVNSNAPLTSQEMFEFCSQLDRKISKASLKSPHVEEWLTGTVPGIYRLKCNSDSTNFSVRVEFDEVQWGVEKVLEIDQELSSLVGQIPVEVWDEDLQSAFQRCEEKIIELQNNQEELNQAIDEIEQEIMEEERRDMMREGEDHINWLLSEYGEDVFPDRD